MRAGVHRRHDRRFVSGLPRERHVVNDETEPSTSGGSASRNPPLRPKNSLTDPSLMFGVGPLAAFLLAGGLVSWRDDIGTTNVALLVGLVVVIAATADRAAGVATALVAAFSYNFFHTQPYRSLRIDDGVDVLTVVLLLVIGLVVSEISARAHSAIKVSDRHGDAEHALERSSELLAGGASVQEMWETVRQDLIRLMHVADCRYEDASDSITELPLVSRSGTLQMRHRVWVDSGFQLPDGGAAIPVIHAGATYGQIVLIPRSGSGSLRDERRLAVALADQLGTAVALAGRPIDS